jgi:hypothetical protein
VRVHDVGRSAYLGANAAASREATIARKNKQGGGIVRDRDIGRFGVAC